MERKHIIIGVIIFLLFTLSAAADEVLTTDERVIALTLLGEARGEGWTGMYAVGAVIQKRSQNRKLTPAQVCLQPWQFSIWNAGKGKVKKESELYYLWKSDCNIVLRARNFARHIYKNQELAQGMTGNADHYYSTDRKTPPYWTFNKKTKKPIKPTKKIGKHIFYKLR